jgi:benzoate-CoA ligase family protein
MTPMSDAYDQLPRRFNAAAHFVDRHVAEGRGERIALVSEGRCITYGEVHAQVNRIGNGLRRLGVRIEDRVPLLLPDCPEFAYGFWGAMKIGAVAVPMNPLLPPAEHDHMLNDSRAETAIVHEALAKPMEARRSGLRSLKHVVVVGEPVADEIPFHALLGGESTTLDPAGTTKDDVALWLYTSGTTGVPKAAVHLQHDMVVCCEGYARHVLAVEENDRCYSAAKLSFAYGLGNALYFPFHFGASTVLDAGRPTPEHIAGLIAAHRPTLFFAVPTTYAALLRAAEAGDVDYDFGSVRCCVSAGEPLPKPIFDRWRERFGLEILDGLGSSELCHIVISNRMGHARPGSTGTLVPGCDAKIVDDHGAELPAGEVGHLMVKAESACAYYWNQHARTKEALVGEWVRTGDHYVRDSDGSFWYVGRADDMFKVGGIWVSPAEVESALLEHEAVVEAAVVGAPDADQLTKPFAFVVLAHTHAPSPTLVRELKDFTHARVGGRKVPRGIAFVPELPKAPTGKILRSRLRAVAAGRALPEP